jgi:3-oxo-4-pregnene-20-carboxyl-CoA dehydrogenase alpha subunit
MDFTPTERQLAAAQAYENSSGLRDLPVPEDIGGAGLNVTELGALLTEAGRHADPSALLLMTGALPLARWGDRDRLSERPLLTAALREPSDPFPERPGVTLSGNEVSGVKVGVPYAARADCLLVPVSIAGRSGPAADGSGDSATAVAVVGSGAPGVTVTPTGTTSGPGLPEATVRLDGAPAEAVLGGADSLADLYRLATLAACCLIDGALAEALSLTTQHVASREQFGKVLATFQAVAQKIADVSIASRTLHLATLSACWRLDEGRDAGGAADLAGYWACEVASPAVRDCHHMHGGIGMDTTYPLHRLSSLIADLTRFLGGTEYRLERLACSSI